jgi:hypothetical protein
MPGTAQRLVYEESVRAIVGQASLLDSLRGRAGNLLAAAALVTSFLGGQALAKPTISEGAVIRPIIGAWGWIAISAFIGVAGLTLAIMWPYKWTFEQSAKKLVTEIEKRQSPVEEVERELALRHEYNFEKNRIKLKRLFWCFRGACVLITFEAIAWIMDLA